MGSIALGSPWLQSRSGFPMGSITLRSHWLVQIRISHGLHRPKISMAALAIQIKISHGRHCPLIIMISLADLLCVA